MIIISNDPIVSKPPTPTGPMLPWIGDLGGGASTGGGSGGSTSCNTVIHTSSTGAGLIVNVVYDSSVSCDKPEDVVEL